MSRSTFDSELVHARGRKLSEFATIRADARRKVNQSKVEEFLVSSDVTTFVALWNKIGSVFGLGRVEDAIKQLKNGYSYGNDETRRRILGINEEREVSYTNQTVETLLEGALATTKVKYWDGLYGPVKTYLEGIAAAKTVEDVDNVTMTLVEALR